MWRMQTDLADDQIIRSSNMRSPTSFQFALSISADRLDTQTGELRRVGAPELFVEPEHGEWQNQAGIAFPAEPNGAAFL